MLKLVVALNSLNKWMQLDALAIVILSSLGHYVLAIPTGVDTGAVYHFIREYLSTFDSYPIEEGV